MQYIVFTPVSIILNMLCLILIADPEVLNFSNFDLENVVTPVNIPVYEELLCRSKFNQRKAEKLIKGFKYGFSLGVDVRIKVKRFAPNLKLRVGDPVVLWNKVMKEVREKCYAGPFTSPPFEYFMQSPIGLVPKDGGKDTHLIFHLSYPRDGISVNSLTPTELCKVKYCEFDEAIRRCLDEGQGCSISRSDMKAAFRNLGIKRCHWPLLLMKCKSPIDGNTYYFVDKCLPFGSSISCRHFQDFSDSVAHIVRFFTGKKPINYLDDYLFAALVRAICNGQV